MIKNKLSLVIKIFVSLAILWFLLSRMNWDFITFQKILNEINIAKFSISLSGVLILLFLKSVRWKLLLREENCEYPYLSTFIVYMSSYTIGLLTPGRVGEIARLYYIRQDREITFYKIFKTIVKDRIFDFSVLIWFGLAGLLFYYKLLNDIPAYLYLIISAVIVFLIWVIGTVFFYWFGRGKVIFDFLREAWSSIFERSMVYPWLLTLLSYLVSFIANWFILSALRQNVNLLEVGFILSIMSLVTLIPVTLAGFGTREVSLIFLFSFYNLSPETAVVFSLLQFISFFLWGGIIGWIFWLVKPVSMALIRQDASKLVTLLKRQKTE